MLLAPLRAWPAHIMQLGAVRVQQAPRPSSPSLDARAETVPNRSCRRTDECRSGEDRGGCRDELGRHICPPIPDLSGNRNLRPMASKCCNHWVTAEVNRPRKASRLCRPLLVTRSETTSGVDVGYFEVEPHVVGPARAASHADGNT